MIGRESFLSTTAAVAAATIATALAAAAAAAVGPLSAEAAATNDGLLHLLGLLLGDLREALALGRDDLAVAVADQLLVILNRKMSRDK